MPRIDAIYYAPVKSLALARLERARLDKPGIPGDRAFVVIDDRGALVTQREHFPLVQVRAAYDVDRDQLALSFPDGTVAEGVPEPGAPVRVIEFWADPVEAQEARGTWDDALSTFAGRPLRLARPAPGRAFDGYPLSICSRESLAAFAGAAGVAQDDGRRFRQNIYISGVGGPHQEDSWIGGEVRIGDAVARVKRKDGRCVITTRDPDTGDHALNSLKIIASYREGDDEERGVNFGVYCTIIQAGQAQIGDEVMPL